MTYGSQHSRPVPSSTLQECRVQVLIRYSIRHAEHSQSHLIRCSSAHRRSSDEKRAGPEPRSQYSGSPYLCGRRRPLPSVILLVSTVALFILNEQIDSALLPNVISKSGNRGAPGPAKGHPLTAILQDCVTLLVLFGLTQPRNPIRVVTAPIEPSKTIQHLGPGIRV
jgi:hypothetical protein